MIHNSDESWRSTIYGILGIEKTPDASYWGINNMINHFYEKGTENDFNKMESEAVGWCTSSLTGPDAILCYLDLLEKEIGTFQTCTEDKSIKKYIAITALEFFRAWGRINFVYGAFKYFQSSQKECDYISPATKLKVLCNKYESFLEEDERVEFGELISAFKMAIPTYKNADLEAERQILIGLEKQKEELEEKIAYANKVISETLLKNYDQIWLGRLN